MGNVTTPGRLLVEAAVPDEYKGRVNNMDKKGLYSILEDIAKKDEIR